MAKLNYGYESFVRVPLKILKDGRLSPIDKVVYSVICSYADNITKQAYPMTNTIAKDAGCSRSSVSKSIAKLEEISVIKVERRRDSRGIPSSSIYTLCPLG